MTRQRPPEFENNHAWALDIARRNVEQMKRHIAQSKDETFEEAVTLTIAARLAHAWFLVDLREEALAKIEEIKSLFDDPDEDVEVALGGADYVRRRIREALQ